MLIDKIRKYYHKDYDLNCAETILYAANEEYELSLSSETFKAMSAFGGGMAIEEVCGVATGSICVLGLMFTKERAHESKYINELTKEFMDKFKNNLTTLNCKELKKLYRNDDIRCIGIVESGALILDEIIKRELKKNSNINGN